MSDAMTPGGERFAREVELRVERPEDMAARIGPGGTFIKHADPAPPGSLVALSFVDPSGKVLSRIACRVIETPPEALAHGPGMALQVEQLDRVATAILKQATAHSDRAQQATGQVDQLSADYFTSTAEGPVIGIDLGTTNSCCAIVEGGEARVVTSPHGYETLPSVIFLTPEKNVLVGHKALEQMQGAPERAIYGSKRFVGRPYNPKEVKSFGHFFRYELTADKRGWVAAKIGDDVMSLEVVSAAVLRHIRSMAEDQLGTSVRRAVITVPAYFGETQREATRRAGEMAGLTVERIVNEPTAGAVAFGYGKGLNNTILVYDLGGGTFDASVLRLQGDTMEVLATDGGPFLGGSDFDDRLTEHVLAHIKKEHGMDLHQDPVAMQRVRAAAEAAKKQLSDADSIDIELPYLVQLPDGHVSVTLPVKRELLESITRDLVDRTLVIVQSVIDRAGVTAGDLDDVIMIGGQSRSPLVRQMLQERFGKTPTRKVHPDHAVALGAALVASATDEQADLELTDVLPASIRLAQENDASRVLLPRGKALPAMVNIEVPPQSDGHYRVELLRGEGNTREENEPVGILAMSSGQSSEDAMVTVIVNREGLLSASAEHPDTGEEQEIEIALIEGQQGAAPAGDSFFSW